MTVTSSSTKPNYSEETPLLFNDAATKHEGIYQRFSPARKRAIVALVSWCGLIPLFASGTFIPSIPEIARDLDTTGSVISFAVSLSIFAGSIGALVGASYSTYYGRRPTYLFSLPLLAIGSFGVALSSSVPSLMFYRFVQSMGASPGMAVGGAVIGDIYRLEERGTAMGLFFSAVLLGSALAPPIGGIASEYLSWRMLQFGLGVAGLVAYVIMATFFPETSHPGTRGVDKCGESEGKRKFVWINPLKPLLLLRSPNLFLTTLAGNCVITTDFVLLVPIAYTIGPKYGITSAALIGLCFVPAGLGNAIGAPLAGRLSDSVVVRWRAKRNGVWYPEDRLRATLLGAGVLVPLSLLGCGWTMEYINGPVLDENGSWIGFGRGTVGLGMCFVFLFMNGVGVDMVLSPSAAYIVDIMHERSAEGMATNAGFRSLLLSPTIACIIPCIELFGVAWTDTFAAILSAVGCLIILSIIRYGNEMRAWVDVGYSTANTS